MFYCHVEINIVATALHEHIEVSSYIKEENLFINNNNNK